MNKLQNAITVLVVLLGLFSVSMAIYAEIKQAMANDNVKITDGVCFKWQQKRKVAQIGALAIILLVLAQIIINVAAGWTCRVAMGKDNNWIVPMVFLLLCWVFFIIASNLYAAGTALNTKEEYYCFGVTPGMFAGGAFSTVLSVASGVLFYIKASGLVTSRGNNTVNFAL